MDTSTGRSYHPESEEEVEELKKKMGDKLMMLKNPPTERQMRRVPPRVGKYDPCPCGSGKKFKWCCFTGRRKEVKE